MVKYRLANEVYLWLLGFLAVTILLHWRLTPDLTVLLYIGGAVIGVHLLEVMERVFGGPGTPFRNVFTQAILTVMSIFVITSSGSLLGAGVVLSLSLRYLNLQYEELRQKKTLAAWFGQTAVPMSEKSGRTYLYVVTAIFLLETLLFIII